MKLLQLTNLSKFTQIVGYWVRVAVLAVSMDTLPKKKKNCPKKNQKKKAYLK